MEMDKANIKDLLSEHKYLMTALHNNFGYDFNKPYKFFHIDGKFTMHQIEKELDPHTITVVMIKAKKGCTHIWDVYTNVTTLHLVRYDEYACGKFDIDKCYSHTYNAYDNFWCKSDFDTMRKSDKTDTWVLSQVYTDMRIPNKKASEINAFDRYKVIDHEGNPITDTTRNVAMCDFVPYCGTGKKVGKTYFGWDVRELRLSDYMDKSGYCVYLTRHELGRKLKEIKDKRAKDEYLATDNSDKVATLARLIDQYKAKVAKDLMKADTTDAICEVSKHLDYFSGLHGIIEDFDTFKEKTENKDFGSINASNALYDRINKAIYEYL